MEGEKEEGKQEKVEEEEEERRKYLEDGSVAQQGTLQAT